MCPTGATRLPVNCPFNLDYRYKNTNTLVNLVYVEYNHHLIEMPFAFVMIQLRYGSIGIKQQSLTHSKQERVRTQLIRLTQPVDNSFGEVAPRMRTQKLVIIPWMDHHTTPFYCYSSMQNKMKAGEKQPRKLVGLISTNKGINKSELQQLNIHRIKALGNVEKQTNQTVQRR